MVLDVYLLKTPKVTDTACCFYPPFWELMPGKSTLLLCDLSVIWLQTTAMSGWPNTDKTLDMLQTDCTLSFQGLCYRCICWMMDDKWRKSTLWLGLSAFACSAVNLLLNKGKHLAVFHRIVEPYWRPQLNSWYKELLNNQKNLAGCLE